MNRTVLSDSPRVEQHAVRWLALPFLARKVPQRMARGQFMLITAGRFGREEREQFRTTDELFDAWRRLPRKHRYGRGRETTRFAITVPDDVYLDDEARVDPWAPDARRVLERAAGERAEVVRRDLRGHGKVKAAYQQETQARRGATPAPRSLDLPSKHQHSLGSLFAGMAVLAVVFLAAVAVLR